MITITDKHFSLVSSANTKHVFFIFKDLLSACLYRGKKGVDERIVFIINTA